MHSRMLWHHLPTLNPCISSHTDTPDTCYTQTHTDMLHPVANIYRSSRARYPLSLLYSSYSTPHPPPPSFFHSNTATAS
eukprot:15475_4